ncbi:hypothetical protein SI65_08254 [Aspergillus cristatus]|uniref:Amine oxidase n=1 Tax=Aspergillus cristatus TaxID=573508 RepID=A0A1E3B5K8_ASPCR|nr:hypothetical protein SI65_08254 [Aspergillus cristatus]
MAARNRSEAIQMHVQESWLETPAIPVLQCGRPSCRPNLPSVQGHFHGPQPRSSHHPVYPRAASAQQLLVDSYAYGYFTKAMLVFKNPFWIEKGFCGLVQSFTGPASIIRDCSSPEDGGWVLTCFLCGDTGRKWSQQDDKTRTEVLLEQLGQLYSDKDRVRSEYVATVWHDWTAEQYSGFGCPCPSLPPGVLSAAGDVLREPFWNVHFSGPETSVEWKGFMEGAVRSGERVATEVSKQLVRTPV